MKRPTFATRGEIELFPGKGGWHYVRASLMPMGDGAHFIAINAKVRQREGVGLGDKVYVTFEVRDSGSQPY